MLRSVNEIRGGLGTAVADPDPHLRSAREVTGYHIKAEDGELGHVEDFILDTERWIIRYLVVDTRNWWPGEKVILAPAWIDRICWDSCLVHVDLTRDAIKSCPRFEPAAPVNRAYEERLHDYYGRPKYWE